MRAQSTEHRTQKKNIEDKKSQLFIFSISQFLILCLLFTFHCSLSTASEKWPGVDESVVEKFAKEHGREAKEPLINTDQGDLLLFVFLIAGTVGGFVAGYYWRVLLEQRTKSKEHGNICGTA